MVDESLKYEETKDVVGVGSCKVGTLLVNKKGGKLVLFRPIQNSKLYIDALEREAKVYALLRRPSRFMREKEVPMLITQYFNAGNLEEFLKTHPLHTLEKKDLKKICLDLVSEILSMEAMGIIHRDLKPSNIVINFEREGVYTASIIDFGTCYIEGEEGKEKSCGTPDYTSPEYAQAVIHSATFGEKEKIALATTSKLDVWCLGCVFYLLFKSHLPPWIVPGRGMTPTLDKIAALSQEGIDEMLPQRKDATSIDFILSKMLQIDPERRASPSAIKKALEHIDA